MQPDRFRSSPHRRLVWLVWLALIVPVAQAVAMAHALSHVRVASVGDADDKGAPHSEYCSLCLSAAAITGGGAPVSESVAWFPPAIRHVEPLASLASAVLAAPAAAYLSRAPPSLSR